MSFGLTFDKLLIIGLIALVLIGPERLPGYAQRLGEWVRNLRGYATGARERMREEIGPEFDDIDWQQLDPRRYDPRRIIREALTEPIQDTAADLRSAALGTEPPPRPRRESAYAQRQRFLKEGRPAPFDPEAT